MKKKYKAVYEMFTPAHIGQPTNGSRKIWQVVSRKDKVQALCLTRYHAKKIAKALNK